MSFLGTVLREICKRLQISLIILIIYAYIETIGNIILKKRGNYLKKFSAGYQLTCLGDKGNLRSRNQN